MRLPLFYCSLLLAGLCFNQSYAQSTHWKDLTTVQDICKQYPERMRSLLEDMDLTPSELSEVNIAFQNDQLDEACTELLEYYRKGSSGKWLRTDLPDPGRATLPEAEALCEDRFTFYDQTAVIPRTSDGRLTWSFQGPTGDQEWAWGLNRHSHIGILLNAYLDTGNDKYVAKIDEHLKDWVISSIPYPEKKSSTAMWRGLEVSFRVKEWARVFYTLQDHPALSPATRLLILSSLPEHGHYLRNFHGKTNWMTMELSALTMLGAAWPDFQQSAGWIAYARTKLEAELKAQVYPDGVQNELTSHYHWVALRNFIQFAEICKEAGVILTDSFEERLEDMWNYLAYAMRPNGYGPLNNDSNLDYNRDRVMEAAATYKREDWRYIASNGQEGKVPEGTPTYIFPWAGQVIMRSSYDSDAHWAFFDIGPWGTGHQHNDKLHVSISAYGRDLLVDAGRFAYQGEVAKFRREYAVRSLGHNVILIDGMGQGPGPKITETPVPKQAYHTEPDFDYARGSMMVFESLEGEATHTRSILYLRGMAWIVVDHIETDRPREIRALWHWHPNCTVASEQRDTYSIDPGQGNLRISTLGEDDWKVELVKGQKEPHYQGWYSEKYNTYEPNITSVYKTSIESNASFVWLLVPGKEEVPPLLAEIVSRDNDQIQILLSNAEGIDYDIIVPLNDSQEPVVRNSR